MIAEAQVNIVELEHNQFVSINRNNAVELTITMEAFGTEHKNKIIKALKKAGYDPKIRNSKSVYQFVEIYFNFWYNKVSETNTF